jgi:hypothetical protein
MTRLARTCSIVALAAALLAAGGCIKMKHALTLMPDGSGKMVITFGANTPLFKQLNPEGGSPLDDFTIKTVSSKMQGIVAFTGGRKWQENGWDFTEFTAYFEDITKVGEEGNPDSSKITWTKDGDTYKLTMSNAPIVKMSTDMAANGGPGADPNQAAQAKMAFAGFNVTETYHLPADVTKADGLKIEGRSATGSFTDAEIFDAAKLKAVAEVKERALTASGNPIAAADVAAFKAELEKAKAEWAELKKKLDAEAPAADAPATAPEELEEAPQN